MRAIFVVLAVTAGTARAQVQDLGHRFPAGAGLDAGSQPAEGVYVGDRVVSVAYDELRDRGGRVIPVSGLDIDAYANVLGLSGTKRLDRLYVTAAIAVPIVKLSLRSELPEASIDRLGLGQVFIEPLQLGTRLAHADVIASYSVYAPTSQGERSGLGRPQWSHQLAAGGTWFLDDRRGWRVSALASYVHDEKKRGIDITRGDSVLIQGGAGGRVLDGVDLGIAGYALWQVTDDRGADLPGSLRGARERAFGVGPELDLAVPALRSRIAARLTWDLDGRTRPVGTLLVIGVSVLALR